ncbi:tRNA pseudouridine synthase-like 1 [Ostrinia furnacalis]|uniref:tRNA pseudouridine synthase-like 1 n=1 Tax=Ostrinia furnacalis TaxID=93504 RepID=UPI00103E2B19|nr:tRNA pseudouridine synthase-like 1 [Ostrinia furnacalis]
MKARYLAFFSYIGTRFRSSEKLRVKGKSQYPDPDSVQGMIEMGLYKLKSLNYPQITLSSRTDGGVHALCSSAHFDLDRYGAKIYDPPHICYVLNKYFYNTNSSIFVKKCLRVPDDFNARFKALSRTYLYRLAVLKKDKVLPEHSCIASHIPIEEWKRCHFTRLSNFDIEKLKEGAKYLVGYHDFTTFKKFDKLKQNKSNRRELYSVAVRPGAPLVTSHSQAEESIFDHWEVEFRGRAFVHNQIRRMMGTLISCAIGKLPPEEIKVMLQVPSKHSWHTFIPSCPPDGLYLCKVEYNPQDLVYHDDAALTAEKQEDTDLSDSE